MFHWPTSVSQPLHVFTFRKKKQKKLPGMTHVTELNGHFWACAPQLWSRYQLLLWFIYCQYLNTGCEYFKLFISAQVLSLLSQTHTPTPGTLSLHTHTHTYVSVYCKEAKAPLLKITNCVVLVMNMFNLLKRVFS